MPTQIALNDCPGLIDLVLAGDERGPTFALNGLQCSLERVEQHAVVEAVTTAFSLMVIIPGWYVGEYGKPALVLISGDTQACLQWMPIKPEDKRALIDCMPLGNCDKVKWKLAI